MSKRICLIYNMAQWYREAIFRAIDTEYECDWYFGPVKGDIKEMDTSCLQSVNNYKTFGNINRLYWKQGVLGLLFRKEYHNYFILAESRSLTDYIFILFASYFFPKKKVYIWTHGWYGKEARTEAKFKLWMFKHANGIFLYGNYAKDLLVQKGLPSNKLFVIHNSLHYNQQKILRKILCHTHIYTSHFGNNNPVLIFIGRLTSIKQIDLFIDAVALLNERGEHYNIVFVGDGEMRKSLEQLIHEKELNKITWFYGACYDDKINAELIYNADLCIAPGNVGLTAIHVMSFGCPVISHGDFKWQMPEFEAIKPGITGDFFKRGDVLSLSETISHWFLKNSCKREDICKECFKEIDTQWNPNFQMSVIKKNLKIREE